MSMAEQPELIGDYKVIRELGRGAMGVVYLAVHPSLGRQLAIKVMARELARDPEFLERFRREGEAAAKLRHPNIVQVFDFAQRDGLYFIAMEYLGAATLKDLLLESGQLPVERACAMMDQLLSALALAHSKGIVHRDIKPANVMLTDEGSIALTDFSVAHMKESSKLTQTGAIVGTPEYMAPEQFDGVWDARSDVYATGIVFYELLTGLSPFRSATMTEVMRKQLLTVPDPPALVDFTVPQAVSQVVSQSLEKEPEKRFQSADEMRQAIAAALEETRAGASAVRDPNEPEVRPPLPAGPAPTSPSSPVAPLRSVGSPAKPPEPVPLPVPVVALPPTALPPPLTSGAEQPPALTSGLESPATAGADRRHLLLGGAGALAAMLLVAGIWSGAPKGKTDRTLLPGSTPTPLATVTAPATPQKAPTPEAEPWSLPSPLDQPGPSRRYPKEAPVYLGVGVDEVELGMSGAEIKEVWGEPSGQETALGKKVWTYGPDGSTECVLYFAKGSDELELIAFSTRTFVIEGEPHGHTGATYQNILEAFGEPTARDSESLTYDYWGVLFRFDAAGLCNYISIYEPGSFSDS
jgi:serine/threonine-protein kinase